MKVNAIHRSQRQPGQVPPDQAGLCRPGPLLCGPRTPATGYAECGHARRPGEQGFQEGPPGHRPLHASAVPRPLGGLTVEAALAILQRKADDLNRLKCLMEGSLQDLQVVLADLTRDVADLRARASGQADLPLPPPAEDPAGTPTEAPRP
ncbi:MAG: hypothetical protein UY36_C0001G0028 [Parcubacteria group bacterium GW2011_GWA1_49_11]|nr:MAG: hypothetical protein UY36_C0001G0028 [Parcubacteria group bacterium GW2011_GWA1_49_11]